MSTKENSSWSNQTGSNVWERMLGDEGEQQGEDCYHGDDDALRDLRSVETGSQAKRRNSMHFTGCTDRRGRVQWPRLRLFPRI